MKYSDSRSVQVKEKPKKEAFKMTITPEDETGTDSESTGLVV